MRRRLLHTSLALPLLAAALAGCAGGESTGPGPASAQPGSSPPAPSTTASKPDPFRVAERKAKAFLMAAALKPERVADRLVHPTSAGDRKRVHGVELWLSRLDPRRVELHTGAFTPDTPGRKGIRVEMRVRFGRPPFSHLITAGEFAVEVDDTGVVAVRKTEANRYLGAFTHPYEAQGSVGTVLYGRPDLADEAQQLLAVVDAEGPRIHDDFGGGPATDRPLVLLATSKSQLAHVCSCHPTENLLGLELDGIVYVVLPAWERAQEITRRGVIVHELTHAGMRYMLGAKSRTPYSLGEGIAQYEEQLYDGREGYYRLLDQLEAAYRSGYNSGARWRSTDFMFGARGAAIDLAYDDAFVITRIVIENHGGFTAFRKLVKGFVQTNRTFGDFTPSELNHVFRKATGESFAQISAEAHAWVLSGAWRNNPV